MRTDGAGSSRTSTWLCALLVAPMGVAIRVPVDTNYDFASTSAPFDTFSASDTTLSPIHRDSTDAAVSSETVVMNRSGEKRTTKFTLAGGGGRYYR